MKNGDGLSIWQPKGFEPLGYLTPSLNRYTDYARFYVGLIIHLESLRENEDLGFGVQLSFDFAQRFFPGPHIYKQIKEELIANGAIECDRQYTVGERSMKYRLSQSYERAGIEKFLIRGKAERLLNKKLQHWHNEATSSLNDVHRYLIGWLREVRIGRYAVHSLDENLESYSVDRVQHDNIKALASPTRSLMFPLKKCRFGRVHSPVSYGWKGFRRFLTIKNARLVGIDLRNSQPLLFGLVLLALRQNCGRLPDWLVLATEERDVGYLDVTRFADVRRTDEECKRHARPTIEEDPNSSWSSPRNTMQKREDQGPFIMAEVSANSVNPSSTEVAIAAETYVHTSNNIYPTGESAAQVLCASHDEIETYVTLCEAGQFYDYLMHRHPDLNLTRSEFKVRMFRNVFFGHHEKSKFTPEWKQFSAEFPAIAGIIRELKQVYGHAVIAWILMRVESTLIIDRVCRRLMNESPEAPVVTIHDSILTTPKYRDKIEKVVLEEYGSVGLRPTLNIEDYAQQPLPHRMAKPRRSTR
jgi:hypothetical protein